MFGFLLGTACLIGLVSVIRRGHRYHQCGGYGHCGGRGHHWRGGWGYRGFRPLYMLFEELDASPGQEKVIRNAVDELMEDAHGFRRELYNSRSELAAALRAEPFDRAAVDDLLARHQAKFGEFAGRAVTTLGTIHETLDERQRKSLADLIESGPGFGRFGRRAGPYR